MNWKNIRTLFVVEEDGKAATEKEKSPKPKDDAPKKGKASGKGNTIVRQGQDTPVPPVSPIPPTSGFDTGEMEEVKQKFFESLQKALDDHNLEGVDYLEFRNTLQSFANMPMDEQLRFQSALMAVKTMGASKQVILSSAQHYLGILEKDKEQFTTAVERHKSERVDGQLQRIEQLKARREEKVRLIEELKKELESMSTEINTISSQIQEDKTRIENRYHAYLSIFDTVSGQIKKDVEKIETTAD